jgi:hypothetical protein
MLTPPIPSRARRKPGASSLDYSWFLSKVSRRKGLNTSKSASGHSFEALETTDPHAALREAGALDPTHPGHVRSSPMWVRLHDRVGASDLALELVNQVLGSGPPPDVATELADLAVAIHLRRNDLPAAIALVQRALPLVEPAPRERLERARQGWERALASARAAAN